jgi:hypothetical protein
MKPVNFLFKLPFSYYNTDFALVPATRNYLCSKYIYRTDDYIELWAARIPPMCFTDKPDRPFTAERDTLQIFSIKIASIRGGLRWPLDVFGVVAARDILDDDRQNIIYARGRSNSQTITEEVIL